MDEEGRVIAVQAALGRPFRLGMLYDRRSERIIPGIELWDHDTLQQNTTSTSTVRTMQQQQQQQQQQVETRQDCRVLCTDSLDDIAAALEVDPSLKLSILSGLVEVEGGAAKYLETRQSSSHQQERVTLQYKCTTRTESVKVDRLCQGKAQHTEVFDHGCTATHVVTSVVYGAQAFFVFDRHLTPTEREKRVKGESHVLIKKILRLKLNGKGDLDLPEEEKRRTEEFTCQFFGDFSLRQNPSSFLEAVKLYQELPKLLGAAGENAVPVKVHLYPLTLIDKRATKVVREIKINVINQIDEYFEGMHELAVKSNDILDTDAAKSFPAIQSQIREFMNLTENLKRVMQRELCIVLPRIRGGLDEEKSLLELLNKINQSPVSIHSLRSWLHKRNIHIKDLNEYIRSVSGIKIASEPEDLECIVMNPDNTHSLCLTISMPSNNSQLEKMKRHCLERKLSDGFGKNHQEKCTTDHQPGTTSTSMMVVANGFKDFYNANKTNKGIEFVVAHEFTESDLLHARVRYYKYGELISNEYDLPTKPVNVNLAVQETTYKSITVTWQPLTSSQSGVSSQVISCHKNTTENLPLVVVSRVSVERDTTQVTIPGLAGNTEYEVRVWARYEVGDGSVGENKVTVKTRPSTPPRMLRALRESPRRILLKWQAPTCVADGCRVEEYIIKQENETGQWERALTTPSSETSCKIENFFKSIPKFKVLASCGSDGLSCDSETCTLDITKPTTRQNLKEYVRACSVTSPVTPNIYEPVLKLVSRSSADKIDKFEFGESNFNYQEKVVMLVGATGSGKTTLINGLLNYCFGVEWKDPFRFKIILETLAANQAMSQTAKITSYTLHHMEGFKVPYTLTIVDTPGFGDVSGILRDKEITENIRKFFTTPGNKGITHIDAVGFVANSSMPRLTPTQRYIFDQILCLFGKDIADNIFLLLTFADGKKPQVLSGIKEAKIPYKKYYKFNNSALYAFQDSRHDVAEELGDSDEEGDGSFDSMFWDMGVKSFALFLEELKHVESKSLILTQDVLNERNRLQTYIEGIQRDIRQGLSTLERLKTESEMLEKHRADIERNKNFEYVVEEEVYTPVPIPLGQHVTNCLECNRTCHQYCKIPNDDLKKGCWAMTDGKCRICPNKCVWSVHKNFPYRYELESKKVTKTINELRHRYQEATKKKLTAENLIEEVNEEFNALKIKVLGMTDSVRLCLERLQEIALRPNPMTTVQYLEVLIEAERSQADPGWQARVEQLSVVKKEAECMEMIAEKGFDPFKQYAESKMRNSKSGMWNKVFEYFKN